MSTGNESPQSSSIVGYYKGFNVTITKRDAEAKVKPLIDAAMEAIDYMLEKGFMPSWNTETNKAAVSIAPQDLGKCDKCGAVNKLSTKGKVYCSAKCWL